MRARATVVRGGRVVKPALRRHVTLLLDAGAFVAAERGNRDVVTGDRAASSTPAGSPSTHGGVVGQVWRGGARQAVVSRLLASVRVAALDEDLGRSAGVLLARTLRPATSSTSRSSCSPATAIRSSPRTLLTIRRDGVAGGGAYARTCEIRPRIWRSAKPAQTVRRLCLVHPHEHGRQQHPDRTAPPQTPAAPARTLATLALDAAARYQRHRDALPARAAAGAARPIRSSAPTCARSPRA